MDLRVMSPSGFQDGRRSSAVFLTTLPRCGASEEAGIFRSSPNPVARPVRTLREDVETGERFVGRLDRTSGILLESDPLAFL